MHIIHPYDSLRHKVINSGGEINLEKPFRTKCGCTIEKIIFRQNGNADNPVVPGSLVFLGNNPGSDADDNTKEILIQNMEELKILRDIVCTKPSLTSRLDDLSKYAFTAVKDTLRQLGGTFILEKSIPIVVDTCTDYGFIYHLNAKKVKLIDNRQILILKEMDTETEKQIIEGKYCEPDECWWEGSEWYAEWEGLLETFDAILEAATTKR